jgi:hypothetical protein
MKEIIINRVNQGGISDSKYEGEQYSVASLVGVDIHDTPGVLKANFRLKLESGTTVDEFCKSAIVSSNGNVYFFSSESGKIWARNSSAVYSLKYTTVPTSGEAKTLGAAEFDGYLYWATEDHLYRVPVNSADWGALQDAWVTATSYSVDDVVVHNSVNYVCITGHTSGATTEPGGGVDWEDNWELSTDEYVIEWADFDITDSEFHPMKTFSGNLWIGDNYYIANVSNNIFTSKALDLPSDQRIRALDKLDLQLAIGTYVDNYVHKSGIYRWDGWSPSWNMDDDVEEQGLNAFIPVDNYFFVQAGTDGHIYSYDNNMLYLTKRIPGDFSGDLTSTIHPNAVAFFKGRSLFGVSNGAGSTSSGAPTGIYSLATVNPRLYNRVMALEYKTSTNSGTTEIGALAVRDNLLFVTWQSGSATGVDVLDYTTRFTPAYLESRVIYLTREEASIYTKFVIGYAEMPTGCSVKAYYKQNYASSWTEITLSQDTIRNMYYSDIRIESNILEFKVELISNEDDTPVIDYISLQGEDNG